MNIQDPLLPKLVLIAGPTASGKSALGILLAQQANGIIINADSAQVYRDLRILSARPTEEEESHVPHRLYGYRDGAEPCSAADWATDARKEIHAAHKAGHLPILIGGTGLYLKTLLYGIAPVPDIDPGIRQKVRALLVQEAYAALMQEDAFVARRLQPTDASRIARALEVVRSTGRSLAEWQKERVGDIAAEINLMPLILLPPRDWIYQRCDQRFRYMMEPDGLEEARMLLERKLDSSLPVMRAIGVPQIAALLKGEISKDEALAAGQIATRQYAKRQYTWFKRQPPEEWPRHCEALDSGGAQEKAIMLLGQSQ